MASGRGHGLRSPSFRPRSVDHLRSVKDGNADWRWKSLWTARSLAGALLLLVIIRILGQGLLMGVAGAVLILLLQEATDPTGLFWTVPWEALQLFLSRDRRVNHIWLHHTQELARESVGGPSQLDGFAMADGFVLIGVGSNKQFARWTAECAWRGIVRGCEQAQHPKRPRGCKAVRFLVAVWLMIGGLIALWTARGIDLPAALLIVVFSAATGHALARPVENMLAKWLATPASQCEEVRGYCLEVEPVEVPEWLWWRESDGFIVRRIPEEATRNA